MSQRQPLLDADTAAFIERAVSINIATRDQVNRPAVARAAGSRPETAANRLTIFLSARDNHTLLDNLRSNHCLAVVFSRPSTHQTIQFKGTDAHIVPVTEEDHPLIRAYQDSFVQELLQIGFPPAFCQAIFPPLDELYLGICFTPERAYSQTPGPNAGKTL